jgi:hypothetical protein
VDETVKDRLILRRGGRFAPDLFPQDHALVEFDH